ncbi:hypothetical protein LXM25_26130 [Dyadobacter sp. LJ53]|uniref:hypothetical protein n=1 Tax=Dyadobacter chenwenxiniae TaxID=2906456 RepID=UPI001F3E13F6|nr:hypothetical protein [Dyadobacter chenwenxiniae]MCF0053578.1 hypothetical protein [Dyadobacter chenwenxiniae]
MTIISTYTLYVPPNFPTSLDDSAYCDDVMNSHSKTNKALRFSRRPGFNEYVVQLPFLPEVIRHEGRAAGSDEEPGKRVTAGFDQ